jgi:hypothetical protein
MIIRNDLTKVFAFLSALFVISVSAQNPDANNRSSSSSGGNGDSIYTLRAGTTIRARMDNEINSAVSSVDDTFTVTVSKPVAVRETEVLPVGTVLEGRVTEVKPAFLAGGDGSFTVRFETLRLKNGAKRSIEATLTNFEIPKSSGGGGGATRNILTVLGGTAVGALIGAVSKKENGVLIGAGLGAGAGAGAVLLRKGREARIRADEDIEIRLNKDVTLPVEDF